MHWLISAKSSVYDHEKSFADFGYIDWKQGRINYAIGDIVYIYAVKPIKEIKYKCIVQKVNLSISETRDDRSYWKDPSQYEKSVDGKFCRLLLIKSVDNKSLHLDRLKNNGLKAAPQGPQKLREDLLEYIEKHFLLSLEELKSNEELKVTSYVYARSPDIVAESLIRANGYCEKCKKIAPFKKKKDGSPYLEVHHKVRLCDGGEDTLDNTIELCPNCHRKEHYGIK
jgi:5-methylcytosine-specific restriction protein A